MKRILFALTLALAMFVVLNVVYSNLDEGTLNYPIVFKFTFPGLFTLRSTPLPSGFVMILAFSLGMVSLALIEALPSFYRSLAFRDQKKRMKELEREVDRLRTLASAQEQAQPLSDSLSH